MAVSYAQNLSTDMILSEVEAFIDWKGDVLRHALFPGAKHPKPATARAPDGLISWLKRAENKHVVDFKVIERLGIVYEDLCRSTQRMLDHVAAGNAVDAKVYDSFDHQCESYVTHLRRLQQDTADSAVAVDAVTGLRTVAGMKNDIRREQDRFDRKGTPFSISAIEIDHVEELREKYDRRSMDAIYAQVATLLSGTIRSFDDAYFLGRGEYVIVLKHLDFTDAGAVLDRLRVMVEKTPTLLPDGHKVSVTASFGLTEAVQKDTADLGIEHAKLAMLDAKEAGGNKIAHYKEVSPLARYAQDIKTT